VGWSKNMFSGEAGGIGQVAEDFGPIPGWPSNSLEGTSAVAIPTSGSSGKAVFGIISLAEAAINDNCEDCRALGPGGGASDNSGRRGDVEGEFVRFC
jgi:hypothetical protein